MSSFNAGDYLPGKVAPMPRSSAPANNVRTFPHNAEAEMGVLGSMMIGGVAVIEELMALFPLSSSDWTQGTEAFYIPANRTIYGALCTLYRAGSPTDFITLTDALRNEGESVLERVGGAAYVTELFTYVPTAGNVKYYADIVREKWLLRQLIGTCTEGVRRAFDDQDDVNGLIQDVQSQMIDIGQLTTSNDPVIPIGDVVPEVVAQIEATYRGRGHPLGLTSGFNDLDRMTGGFMPGRVYIIAARPAMGKTSLATAFAEHVAVDLAEKKKPVLIFSVEMTAHEIAEVMLLRRANVTLGKLRSGMYSKEERAAVDAEAAALTNSGMFIDGTAGLSVFEFRARARRAIVKHGVKLILIDYLQLMRSTSKRAQGNRELEIAEIMQGIIDTAKEMQVPIVALAQLNRDTEKRSIEGIPQLSDLRESGSIEAGAHFVGLLYRPIYYARSEDHAAVLAEKREMSIEAFKSYAELIIAKHRRGPVGTVPLRFVKEFARFESEDPTRPLYSNDDEKRQRI